MIQDDGTASSWFKITAVTENSSLRFGDFQRGFVGLYPEVVCIQVLVDVWSLRIDFVVEEELTSRLKNSTLM